MQERRQAGAGCSHEEYRGDLRNREQGGGHAGQALLQSVMGTQQQRGNTWEENSTEKKICFQIETKRPHDLNNRSFNK